MLYEAPGLIRFLIFVINNVLSLITSMVTFHCNEASNIKQYQSHYHPFHHIFYRIDNQEQKNYEHEIPAQE